MIWFDIFDNGRSRYKREQDEIYMKDRFALILYKLSIIETGDHPGIDLHILLDSINDASSEFIKTFFNVKT